MTDTDNLLLKVTFRVTTRCNNNCVYCFAPKNVTEMDFATIKKLFKLLFSKGVRVVLLTGGEPLLREDFRQIVKELKKYKIKIFLDTSGDLFFKYKNLIIKDIDKLGLPIDFTESSYRNKDNLNTVLRILDYIKNYKKHPLIKIGTVVTKENYKLLTKIGNLIKNYPVDTWKLYQYTPQAVNAIKNRKILEISPLEFDKATDKLPHIFSKYFKVIISKREDRNCAYFMINPDGMVLIPIDDGDICRQVKIGSVFNTDVFDKWKEIILEDNYIINDPVVK